MVYRPPGNKGNASASTAPAATEAKKGGGFRKEEGNNPCVNLRVSQFGAAEDAEGNIPWVKLCSMFKSVYEFEDSGNTSTSLSGNTRVAEDDPEFKQSKYRIKYRDSKIMLSVMHGKRIKKSGAKGKDGRDFTPQSDEIDLGEMKPIVSSKGKVVEGAFECTSAEGDTYQIWPWRSKEEWDKINSEKGSKGKREDVLGKIFG